MNDPMALEYFLFKAFQPLEEKQKPLKSDESETVRRLTR